MDARAEFSADGKYLAGYVQAFPGNRDFSSFRSWLKLWDDKRRELMSVEAQHEQTWLTPCWFSPDGSTLAALSKNKEAKHAASLLLYDVPSAQFAASHRVQVRRRLRFALPTRSQPRRAVDCDFVANKAEVRVGSGRQPQRTTNSRSRGFI